LWNNTLSFSSSTSCSASPHLASRTVMAQDPMIHLGDDVES
jgi:hypothetical protein